MRFALIGNKVEMSPSDYLHSLLFQLNGMTAEYDKVKIDALDKATYDKLIRTYNGYNVTMPFKQTILPFLTEIKTFSGAVNTVTNEGLGYNTDISGAFYSILTAFPEFKGRILIMGNGGAARAFLYACKGFENHFEPESKLSLTFAVRTLSKFNGFPDLPNISAITYDKIKPEYDYIINATSVGYAFDEELLGCDVISASKGVFDAVYSPKPTILKQKCDMCGRKYADGLLMLVYQAVFAQAIWFKGLLPRLNQTEIFASDAIANQGKLLDVEKKIRSYIEGR